MSFLFVFAACSPSNPTKLPPPVSPTNHTWFPIGAGTGHEYGKTVPVDGVIACKSCHDETKSFAQYQCISCHKHPTAIVARLHDGVKVGFTAAGGATSSAGCYQCHASGVKQAFSHTGIPADSSGACAECHQVDAAFAALPKAGFTHNPVVPGECGGCHKNEADWTDVTGGGTAFDPTKSLVVDAGQPTWSGTRITAITRELQIIPMKMNHQASALDAGVLAGCGNCHAQSDLGAYYPGVMHWSLVNLGAPQPSTCLECHDRAAPTGFVGVNDARRTPVSGEMRHDVRWGNTGPQTLGCQVCHQPPDSLVDTQWSFANGRGDGGTALVHASLTAAGIAQPTACLDCHANTRPVLPVAAAALTFDHSTALGECLSCHTSTSSWAGGQFHTAAGPAPTTCLPCHAGDRPTSTTGWVGPYLTSPFDFVTNTNGLTHGSDQDCAVCHAGPGTGTWGTNPNWRSGNFAHAATSVAATTCVNCHTTQRPDLLVPAVDAGYDHATNGTGDCFACHESSYTRGVFVDLMPIPGGDWRGGQSYPADRLISTPRQSVRVLSTTLNRAGPLVTSMTTATANLPNEFTHTSPRIPAAIAPGPAATPDMNSCWHCHTSTGTTVTAFSNGKFHASLTNFRVTPTDPITALAQPTACNDCHAPMRPPNIVSKTDAGVPWLAPMDHGASFTGGSVANVAAMDCGNCHRTPGLGATQWSDGKFHSNLPSGAAPSECVSCHYPLITTVAADVTAPDAGYTMSHRSSPITTQACATCHSDALTRSTTTPTVTPLWKTGAYHASVGGAQPMTCIDCHAVSDPLGATQGTTVYTLTQGGTATNGAGWMNHAHATAAGRDCATCHLADARMSGSTWNKASLYHRTSIVPSNCATCHGVTNGRGTAVGTNNNMPVGLTDTATTTTASPAPAGTKDQIAHTDLNVTGRDCNFCHTQIGSSTTAGVVNVEWTKAAFHRNFTAANPLQLNGTTARCSNCHLNVKPGPAYTQEAHAAFTGAPTSQDCSSCHSWPGTSGSTPNWLGATGAHASTGSTVTSLLDCNTCHGQGGTSQKHLAGPAAQHYGGVNNGNQCTSCHINFAGFKDTVTNLKYAHTNATANGGQGCANCHVFASQLYTTLTITPPLTHPTVAAGHQFSQTFSVTGTRANCGDTNPNGCFTSTHTNAGLSKCSSCHVYTATTAALDVWTFRHQASNPGISNSKNTTSGCTMCH